MTALNGTNLNSKQSNREMPKGPNSEFSIPNNRDSSVTFLKNIFVPFYTAPNYDAPYFPVLINDNHILSFRLMNLQQNKVFFKHRVNYLF